MFGVQQEHRLSFPCLSLATQHIVFELSGSLLSPTQNVLLLVQLLPVVCDQIHVVNQPASAGSDFRNHWQVQGLPCCVWDIHGFGPEPSALAAQKVEVVEVGGVQRV